MAAQSILIESLQNHKASESLGQLQAKPSQTATEFAFNDRIEHLTFIKRFTALRVGISIQVSKLMPCSISGPEPQRSVIM